MRAYNREITKEQFDRADDRGYLAHADYLKIFDESERMGYGVYADHVFEKDGKYYVSFEMGDSCD